MRQERIGIDLGSESIKMVALRGEREPYSIRAMESFQVEKNLSIDDYMSRLKTYIKKFTKENRIKKASLCFTLPLNDQHTLNTFITLPTIKKRLLKKSIAYEIEDSGFGDNIGHYYHKWDIVDSDPDGNKNNILILAVKRELIHRLSKIGNLKYSIDHVEIQPATLGRMIWGSKAVIDFGHSATRIFSFKDGKPFLIKTISIGGMDFDEIIRQEMGDIPDSQVYEIKQQLSINSENEDIIINKIAKQARKKSLELIEEIRRYIRSIELQYDLFFDNIHYTGGIGNLLGLYDLISTELMLDLRPLETMDLTEDSELSENEMNLFFFAISVGMYKSKPYYTNLYFSKLAKTQVDYFSILIAVICTSAIIHFAAVDINKRYDERLGEVKELAGSQTTVVRQMEDEIKQYETEVASSNQYVDRINAISGQKKWLSDVLYVLSVETPKEVVIKKIQLQDGQLKIDGYAENYSSVGFIAMSLEKHGTFTIDTITNVLSENYYSEKGTLMTRGFSGTLNYPKNSRLSSETEINSIKDSITNEFSTEEKIEKLKETIKEIERIANEKNSNSEEMGEESIESSEGKAER